MTGRRAPDFLCIGAQKAATAWLADRLSQHPGVWRPRIKELHFFDAVAEGFPAAWRARIAGRLARRAGALAARGARETAARLRALADPARMDGFGWYLELFGAAPAGLRLGDFTPRCSALPAPAVERLVGRLPEARFLWLIREPAARMESAFRMEAKRARAGPGELPALAARWFAAGRHDRGDYADFIPRQEARLGPDRLCFIAFGDIARRPEAVLDELSDFLGLPRFAGWRRAGEALRPTPPTPLPPEVRAEIEAQAAPHRAFLERRFGAEFLARTR